MSMFVISFIVVAAQATACDTSCVMARSQQDRDLRELTAIVRDSALADVRPDLDTVAILWRRYRRLECAAVGLAQPGDGDQRCQGLVNELRIRALRNSFADSLFGPDADSDTSDSSCPEGATTGDLQECTVRSARQAERALADVVARTRRTLPIRARTPFDVANRAWRTYATRYCSTLAYLLGGASIGPVVADECVREQFVERQSLLKTLYVAGPP